MTAKISLENAITTLSISHLSLLILTLWTLHCFIKSRNSSISRANPIVIGAIVIFAILLRVKICEVNPTLITTSQLQADFSIIVVEVLDRQFLDDHFQTAIFYSTIAQFQTVKDQVQVCKLWDQQLLIHIAKTCRPSFTKSPSLDRYSHLKMSNFTNKCMAIRTLSDTASGRQTFLY